MIRNNFISIWAFALVAGFSVLPINRSPRSVHTCGVSKTPLPLIVGGQNFTRGAFPWIVALLHTGWTPPKFFCGGTLISKTFVITGNLLNSIDCKAFTAFKFPAAHCILQKHATKELLPRNILALFGAHDLSDSFETGRYALSPKEIFIHDKWNPRTTEYDSDLSLFQFEEQAIHFNSFVQPICLWDSGNEMTVTEGVVTGWGKSDDATKSHENLPKLVQVPIQLNEDCFFDEGKLLPLSSRKTFCAGLRNGSGVCQGDSGGGLFTRVDGVYHLRGIVSSSLIKDGGCDISKNAVYTNVLKFRDWIKDIAGVPCKKL